MTSEPAVGNRRERDAIPLERVIAFADFRAALRRFQRHSERVEARHGLTPQRHLLLLMVKGAADGSERLSVGAAAERLQLGVNTTTELINRAEESGLVRRERSREDARVVYLRLTPEGERRLARVLVELDANRKQLQEALGSLTRSFRRTAGPGS
jgi:DNA-binding MarR family transcriptional regulator